MSNQIKKEYDKLSITKDIMERETIIHQFYATGFLDRNDAIEKIISIHNTDAELALATRAKQAERGRKNVFAYTVQTACDKNGWVLGYSIHPGNLHGSRTFKTLYDKIKDIRIKTLIADAGYKTPAITNIRVAVKPVQAVRTLHSVHRVEIM